MYNDILSMTYSQCRDTYPDFKSISKAKKIIAMKNCSLIDSYSDDSDIIIHYDIVSDSRPLVLDERLDADCYDFDKVVADIDAIKDEIIGYHAVVVVSDDMQFIDIVLTLDNIYKALLKQ